MVNGSTVASVSRTERTDPPLARPKPRNGVASPGERLGARPVIAPRSSMIAAALTGASSRSEEHTSELQSLMRISYAVFCLKKKNKINKRCVHKISEKPNIHKL